MAQRRLEGFEKESSLSFQTYQYNLSSVNMSVERLQVYEHKYLFPMGTDIGYNRVAPGLF